MSLFEALIARLVRWTPGHFRERYGDEYLATVHDRMVDAARGGLWSSMSTGVVEVIGAVRVMVGVRSGGRGSHPSGMTTQAWASFVATITQDIRHATRTLSRNPGFTAAAVAVLALGIGSTTAIFSAANAFFFRPLPFDEADRLVLLYETNPEFGWDAAEVAPANALDWRAQVDAFSDVAMYADFGVDEITIERGGAPVIVGGTSVTGNFFSVLGVGPQLGRTFRYEETWAGSNRTVVVAHHMWIDHFGADPDIIGRTIPISGTDVEIIGVMPEGFRFPDDETDLWFTYGWATTAPDETWFRRAHFARGVARLQTGVSLEEADAQLQVVVRRLQREYPATNRVMGAGLMPVRDFLVREVRTPLSVLMGAVSILLLLACANVANLVLVRAKHRQREVALRHALGAGRARVARVFLTESLLLAGAGGALGLLAGWFGIQAMATATRLGIAGATGVALDGRVVGFTVLISAVSGMVFGITPAISGSGRDIQGALRDGGQRLSAGRGGLRMAGALVAAEVALALVLVVGAGLMVRTAWLLRQVDPGFEVEGALAVQFTVPATSYPERDQVLSFWDRFTEALEGRPGIERAGTVGRLPLDGTSWSSQFQAEGWPPERVGFEILHRRADSGYFQALDIPLLSGRLFAATDGPDDPLVVVINETFAREHFPGEDPIGQKIAYDRQATLESTWYEIIGVVGDQSQASMRTPARAEAFESRHQDWSRQAWVVLRTSVEPLSVIPAVRGTLAEMDARIPIAEVRPLRDVWSASMDQEAFLLMLLALFGVAALLLATVGVYTVTAEAARRRTQEIGIRMALGASAPDVVRLMLRQGLLVIGLGLVVGLAIALPAMRALGSFLFGIRPTDPSTLAVVVALLGSVAVLACYVPARRATRVDPVSSLGAE